MIVKPSIAGLSLVVSAALFAQAPPKVEVASIAKLNGSMREGLLLNSRSIL
jgi:hypothetical protein